MSLLNIFKRKPKTVEVLIKYFHQEISQEALRFTGDWVDVRIHRNPYVLCPSGQVSKLPPKYVANGREVYSIEKGTLIKVPLGFGAKLPENHEADMRPRSSLAKNTGLLFATSGVIDEGYCGEEDEWFIALYATRDTLLTQGERIAQFRIQEKQPNLVLKVVTKLEEKSRGGHGSTGRF